jgi:Mn2+/Fe2+ NRAMP family transporter
MKCNEDNKTRSIIALTIAGLCVFFLVGAAVLGYSKNGDFSALECVFNYVQAPLGVLVGYYFSR